MKISITRVRNKIFYGTSVVWYQWYFMVAMLQCLIDAPLILINMFKLQHSLKKSPRYLLYLHWFSVVSCTSTLDHWNHLFSFMKFDKILYKSLLKPFLCNIRIKLELNRQLLQLLNLFIYCSLFVNGNWIMSWTCQCSWISETFFWYS